MGTLPDRNRYRTGRWPELFFHQVIENEDGDKIGCGCETWPIKWRAEEAMRLLQKGDYQDANDLLQDILREIAVAEMRNVPCLNILPDNARITEAGECLIDAA